jgi:PAS domain-containing protein
VGVVVCDPDRHVVFFSPEAERILGIGAMHADFVEWSASSGRYRPDMVTLSTRGTAARPGHAGGGSASPVDFCQEPATARGALDRCQRDAAAGQFGYGLWWHCGFF